MDRQALVELIAESVRGYRLAMLRTDSPIDRQTRLFGPGGVLDSLGLVSVLVEIEQKLSDLHGMDVSLLDDRAVSQTKSPFRTVDSLADYAWRQTPAGKPL